MRWIVPILISASLLGCSKEESKEETVARELTPEEKAEIQARREKERQQRLEEELAFRSALIAASDDQLYDVLDDCKDRVEEEAASDNNGPFGHHLVDEYSADVYLYAAGSAAETYEERVDSLRSSLSQEYLEYFYPGVFNTQFAFIFASDSFSGPQKGVFTYSCEISSNLDVVKVNKPLKFRYR